MCEFLKNLLSGSKGRTKPQIHIEQIFTLGLDMAEKVVNNVKHVSGNLEDSAYKSTLFAFFLKSYKTYQAVIMLWRAGFPEDAFMLVRTLFEIRLQVRYMSEDPRARVRLFLEHDPVLRYKRYLRLKKEGMHDVVAGIECHQQELSELEQHYNEYKNNYASSNTWWGQNIEWLAKHFGEDTYWKYLTVYWMQSSLIHSNVTFAKQYLQEDSKGQIRGHCYPSVSHDAKAAYEATAYFLEVANQMAIDFGFGEYAKASSEQFVELCKELAKERRENDEKLFQ